MGYTLFNIDQLTYIEIDSLVADYIKENTHNPKNKMTDKEIEEQVKILEAQSKNG